ncbi:MAG: UDP-N-acetylmuramoyl-L-alanyl-D-glutamate--2,6-diaminopimelate ligase, partial [Anaerolineae bacterium]|nr:UDP-N-acetylmuramoyl-L-alanyl-D-glutamate--2,6-diaminopimelate ligase [Anaerolineae bacterium]
MPKKLSELIQNLPDVIRVSGDADINAPVAESDADLQPGGVFVARPGLSVDGHDFIPRAIAKGAAAVVGERDLRDLSVPYVQVKNAQEATGYLAEAYHDFPSRKLVVIGVTGTDGKTTTSTLIHSILQVATGGKAGLISTVNAVIGGQTLDTGLHVTTPNAPMIHSLLAQMVDNGLTHCVLEMTSHGLAQGRLNGVDVDVAVLTNLTHEHLDYHGSFENYRAAKGRLFEMLGQSYRKPNQPKISVINADDPNAEFFAAFQADEVIRYGTESQDADWKVVHIDYEPDKTYFNVYPNWAEVLQWRRHGNSISPIIYRLSTYLLGKFNVSNVTAAAATSGHNAASLDASTSDVYTGRVPGVWIATMEEGIEAVKSIPGRMERIDEGQKFTAIVDFAHTPNALRNALQAAKEMLEPGQKLIAAFGSAGLRDKEKRRLMA